MSKESNFLAALVSETTGSSHTGIFFFYSAPEFRGATQICRVGFTKKKPGLLERELA